MPLSLYSARIGTKLRLCGYKILIVLVCLGIITSVVICYGCKRSQIGFDYETILRPMMLPKNIVIPNCPSKIILTSVFNILIPFQRCFYIASCRRDPIFIWGQQHRIINRIWIYISHRNICNVRKFANNGDNIYCGGSSRIFEMYAENNSSRFPTVGINQELGMCDTRNNPCPFIQFSCFLHFTQLTSQDLHLLNGIGLADAKFLFHRLPLTIEGFPFQNGKKSINGNENNFGNMKPKCPLFASVCWLMLGIICLAIGLVNFNQRRNEHFYFIAFFVGCFCFFFGLCGIAFWW